MLSLVTRFSFLSLFLACFLSAVSAAPLLDDIVTDDGDANVLSSLTGIVPTAAPPASVAEASQRLSSVINTEPTPASYLTVAEDLVEAGLTSQNFNDALSFAQNGLNGPNSDHNINPKNPHPPAYPRAGRRDAPYDLSEEQLRGAIYIPPTFQYGAGYAPPPAILVPGTGNTGYVSFVGNYIPLLQNSTVADPVWLNIPGFLLGDAQTNAEYVAYAINYIYGISNHRQVSVISWSQGGIDAQWAFKYWPSTRSRVSDHIALSPDYHGTITASNTGQPQPPAFLQQAYNSNFITTLRSNGGDAAYVSTTTVYSGFYDEIVEPQQGRNASAYLKSSRSATASNNEVQLVCPGQVAGSFYTHEGILFNPLGYALAMDALTHDGPGQPSRLDLTSVCSSYLTPGLDLTDFLLTENTIVFATVTSETYPNKTTTEPPIKGKWSPGFD